jgi:hypothetical protein
MLSKTRERDAGEVKERNPLRERAFQSTRRLSALTQAVESSLTLSKTGEITRAILDTSDAGYAGYLGNP